MALLGASFNPYHDATFGTFIVQFFIRLWTLLTGQATFQDLATDEIQVFVLAGVAASSALVGSFLVLRRMTMLANSLSHTILIGIVLAYLWTRHAEGGYHEGEAALSLKAMLMASLAVGFLTTFLTEFLTKTVRLQEDASTGLIFTSLFALGVVLLTLLTRNAHIGTEAVMGNADALHVNDLKMVYLILLFNALFIILFFKEFKITTFDPALAKALGFSLLFFNYLLMAQVSITVIGAFRAVGVLLVLAFITAPPLTARLLFNDLKEMLLASVAIGVGASFVGVALTRHVLSVCGIALSTSGVVVCTLAFCYALALLFAPRRGLWAMYFHRKDALNKSSFNSID